MAISLYPFPHKLSDIGQIRAGYLQDVPRHCHRKCDSMVCRHFYLQLTDNDKFVRCPHGFVVYMTEIGEQKVIFSGMNIEGLSDRKMLKRNISNSDYCPRMPRLVFYQALDVLRRLSETHQKVFVEENNLESQKDAFIDKAELLDNTLHELRKLNQSFKIYCEQLIYTADHFHKEDKEVLRAQAQQAYSISQLMTIRFNTYDFGINPELVFNESKRPIAIHQKFLKACKCLKIKALEKQIYINLEGESFSKFKAIDLLELLPYIFLENAIKYSLPSRSITVDFKEFESDLYVDITSFSLRPQEKELPNLRERGFRSVNAPFVEQEGQGLGLYMAGIICDFHSIGMDISLGNKREYSNGYSYSNFIVHLHFPNIIKLEKPDVEEVFGDFL